MRFVFYPLLVGSAVVGWWLAASRLDDALLPLLNAAISLAVIPLLIIAEHRWPHQRAWLTQRGDVVADLFSSLVVLPFVIFGAEQLDRAALPTLRVFDDETPLALQLTVGLIAAEFMHFWVHRLAHHWKPLWKLHAVHHGAPRLYWGNAGRFHALDVAVIFPLYFLPLILLGASPRAFALFLVVNAVTGFLEHANVDFVTGPLRYVMNTAELHRLHHADDVVTSRHNYGKVLCVWDVVFRTHLLGPSRLDIGAGVPVPVTVSGQLLHPFRHGITEP
jgi:sterol desaturase/sphingolipid hydroxylase (fatty acid hydroxylase superfamily)